MKRDVGMTDELSVPDLSRSQSEGFSPHHSLRTDSQNGMLEIGFIVFLLKKRKMYSSKKVKMSTGNTEKNYINT